MANRILALVEHRVGADQVIGREVMEPLADPLLGSASGRARQAHPADQAAQGGRRRRPMDRQQMLFVSRRSATIVVS